MSTVERGSDESSGPIASGVELLRESLLLKIAAAGVGLVAVAALFQTFVVDPTDPGMAGVWAALLPVWGTGLFVVGVGGYLFVWWRQNRNVA